MIFFNLKIDFRNRANTLRRLIAEANLTYENLEEAWKKDKKESLTALVKERITTAKKPEDLDDLTETLLRHFGSDNTTKTPQKRDKKVFILLLLLLLLSFSIKKNTAAFFLIWFFLIKTFYLERETGW